MPKFKLSFASGEDSLSARAFSSEEAISRLFEVSVVAMSERPDIDFEAIVGQPASFSIESGVLHVTRWGRHWKGIVSHLEQVGVEVSDKGQSTYVITLSPTLWLLTQRRGHRVFQHMSVLEIVDELLAEWSVEATWAVDRGAYPKLEYKVQYGESDYSFLCRLLEEAGIAFTFPQTEEAGSLLTFWDNLTAGEPHGEPIPFVDEPNQAAQKPFVTDIQLSAGVRPGAYVIRDHDFRNPGFALLGEAPPAKGSERLLEQYHYRPGSFLVENDKAGRGGGTPVADDKGIARHDAATGRARAARLLDAERTGKRQISFGTNVLGLVPGMLFTIDQHPSPALTPSERLLVTAFHFEGTVVGEWTMSGRAVFAKTPYRPPLVTPRPEIRGVESAVVVGPPGEEIHADEFGRVRVQFPWDRQGKTDDNSSCWMRVSQGWAGMGFGALNLPRVGQEVLVGFLGGDPDQPIVVGRVFNGTRQVPYKLPDHKTRSTWRSQSSPGGEGFNEILFEDAKDKELVYMQAQKNLRRLVKNDETITVLRDRHKLVKNDETETTNRNRVEVTGADRTEITGQDRTIAIGQHLGKLVGGDESEQTRGHHKRLVEKGQDIVIRGVKRESIDGEHHLVVRQGQRRKVGGDDALVVDGGRHIKIGGRHALDVGGEVHVKAGTAIVIEAADDLTLMGPGGFIRINDEGIFIKGKVVNINSGGVAGSGSGVQATLPREAEEAAVAEPERPVPDDISVTGLGQ